MAKCTLLIIFSKSDDLDADIPQCLRFSNSSISVDVLDHILEMIRDRAVQAHESKFIELRDEYNNLVKNNFVGKVLLPWILYLRGIDYIKGKLIDLEYYENCLTM